MLGRRTIAGLVFAFIVYALALAIGDARALAQALREFGWLAFAAALGASAINYALRFAKWELSLGWLDVRADHTVPRAGSIRVYLAGLSMSVTPGKLGEVLRSGLLAERYGVPAATTAPIVVADRLTDVIALLILGSVGMLNHPTLWPVAGAAVVGVLGVIAVLGSQGRMESIATVCERRRSERLRRGGAVLRTMAHSSAALLRPGRLLVLTVLSVAGWGLECVGYWAVLHGFVGVEASLATATFLWSATTLVGALSFLPGGLGATEASLWALAPRMVTGLASGTAAASTLLIRLATLWFGVAVGTLALAAHLWLGRTSAGEAPSPR